MVDARLPERFLVDRRLTRLTSSAFRSYVCGLLWAVTNRTDGAIDSDDVPGIPGLAPIDISDLVAAGLWLHLDGGFQIADFAATQTSSDELTMLENIRRRAREKKARQRAKAVEAAPDVPGDMSPGTAQAGRPGIKEERREPSLFCIQHPTGTAGGAPCTACRDARRIHEAWMRSQRDRAGATPRKRADPATCDHRRHPVDPICLLCDAQLEEEAHATA